MALGTCWRALLSFLKSLHSRHDLVSGGGGCAGRCVLSHLSCVKCVTLCDPMDRSLPAGLLCPWDSPGKNTGVSCLALLWDLLDPEIEPMSLTSNLHWQEGSLPLAPPGLIVLILWQLS